jgi:replicative DNA helicase
MDNLEKLPPQALEMETHVLGGMLLDREAAGIAVEILAPEDFYKGSHQKIFKAAAELYDEQQTLDQALLREELSKRGQLEEVGGVGYLAELVGAVPTTAHVEQYAAVVKDRALARQLIAAATDMVRSSYEPGRPAHDLLDAAEQRIFKLSTERAGEVHDIREIIHDVYKRLEESHGKGGVYTGIATGYPDLDELTSGLQRGELTIIAGRPSTGKTSFSLNVLMRLASEQAIPVGIFSLEMTKEQVAQNLACLTARVDSRKLRRGMLNQEEWGRLVNEGMGRLREAPIFIDDSPGEPLIVQLRARARRMVARQKVGLIIFDYLQLIHGPREIAAQSRQQEVAYVSRSLKALARELNIPIIAVCQLNRGLEDRTNKRPQLSDLRESGAIEQDADLVMLIHRPGIYQDPPDMDAPTTLLIAKNRNGPVGDLQLTFLSQYFRFESFRPEGL